MALSQNTAILSVINVIPRSWINLLNAELNPICHLLALLEGATIVDVSGLRVKGGSETGGIS
jgi:hypothetical protein